ncbi:hypothetical protein P4S72_20175 [Vibrio sp. PP-XX7]
MSGRLNKTREQFWCITAQIEIGNCPFEALIGVRVRRPLCQSIASDDAASNDWLSAALVKWGE